MMAPFKTTTPANNNVKGLTKTGFHNNVNMHSYSQPRLSHRLTSWRWCSLSDSATEWSSNSSAGNCCHLNGVVGRGCQQCGSVGSLTLASPRHRNTHCTATITAVVYCVSCNVTVVINAWDTTPVNKDANRTGSHCSDICGWITRGWGLKKYRLKMTEICGWLKPE